MLQSQQEHTINDDDKASYVVPLAVSVQDINDNVGEQEMILRKSQAMTIMSRIPTPKFKKSQIGSNSFHDSYMNELLSSSMGKNRELPDDNVLNSSYKLLLSPAGREEGNFNLPPTDFTTIDPS